jgi:hypothetical protein
VKLLDFGLAKTSPAAKTAAVDETVTRAPTQEGSIVGTLQYMAPEQLQGKDTDARSDIFSFGCVLYELFTGRCAFDGSDSASIIAAILKEEPAPMTPPALDRLVRKCLAKDPDDRWQSRETCATSCFGLRRATSRLPLPRSRRAGSGRGFASIAVAILAAVVAFAFFRPPTPAAAPERVLRFPLPLPENTRFTAVSPDGEKVLFGMPTGENTRQVWIYHLTSGESRPLADLENFASVFWAPDSRTIGFSGGTQFRKFDLATGLVSAIHDGAVASGAWSPDGSILVSKSGEGVSRLPAEGGEAKALTKLVPPDAGHFGIVPLHDGRRFLFFSTGRVDAGGAGTGTIASMGEIRVGSIDGKPPVALMKSDGVVTYAQPGYLLYLKGDTLVAQPFDASRAAITGPAHPLINRVGRQRFNTALPLFSVSQNGALIYQSGTRFVQSRLTWFDRSGKASGTFGELADYSNPAESPDGARLAVCVRDAQTGTRDIWILDLVRGGSTRFTFDPSDDTNPVWSPDGSQIAFTSARQGARDLYTEKCIRRWAGGTAAGLWCG